MERIRKNSNSEFKKTEQIEEAIVIEQLCSLSVSPQTKFQMMNFNIQS